MRYAYSYTPETGITAREISLVRVDKRDLDEYGNSVHIQVPLGPKVAESPEGEYPGWVEFEPIDYVGLQEGEIEVDHILTRQEILDLFPDYETAEVEPATKASRKKR